MSRPVAVLRPEPGNAATAGRLRAVGIEPICLPLFAVRPLPWSLPHGAHDALILTSANAVRQAGDQLTSLASLPVYAVGPQTAEAAHAAGLRVAHTGDGDGEALCRAASDQGVSAALHLCGREHRLRVGGPIRTVVPVYASDATALAGHAAAQLNGSVAMVHSARAGRRLAEVADRFEIDRSGIVIAAISERAATAAGSGWAAVETANRPDDDHLVALARRLAD
ncbi:uroporphyrinogen-III synthase [Stakelama marina]|uniref:Uroporphyrinogen-III synthase n=1 Tax=Stakelama marina TaxID=2826939 RepID=A0A8T4IEP3_9SPHN|nr:uroporphyrinogen-III synthase [Stakelama marina]MBR0553023.1 uroporphyrinogen-III synthase [Stakelama marina]